jgi:hypothetical protein
MLNQPSASFLSSTELLCLVCEDEFITFLRMHDLCIRDVYRWSEFNKRCIIIAFMRDNIESLSLVGNLSLTAGFFS